MQRILTMIFLSIALQACSTQRRVDTEAALFEALFDVPRGSCKQLRRQLRTEIEIIKKAQKKADDEFLAEQDAPPEQTVPPRLAREVDPLAALRDVARKTAHAEKINMALKVRRCRTVDIEEAVRAP
jgi:hypothetical protein